MAVISREGPPTLMVTFTANPEWPKVEKNQAKTGMMDRADVIDGVFNMKLNTCLQL